ncbi:MAG TPA: zinc ribbon domain-containing protein [Crenotrichaceae bacterium]|nr:zinc ribbon domain-containing protein [Crenotrichaceae bacterium]
MPIYEYQCEHCHHTFDALQKISEDPLVKCPECEKDTLKKLISPAGFRLKGTGWYETDFKGTNKKPDKTKSDSGSSKKSTESKSKSSGTSD